MDVLDCLIADPLLKNKAASLNSGNRAEPSLWGIFDEVKSMIDGTVEHCPIC